MKRSSAATLSAIALIAAFAAFASCASVSSAIVPGERFVPLEKPGTTYSIGQIIEMDSSRIDVVYDPRVPADLSEANPGELPSLTGNSLASRYTSLAKSAMEESGAKLGDVKVAVQFRDCSLRSIPTYSLYKHIQDQVTKNSELRSMILSYAAVGARFEVISGTVHGRLSLSVTDATGKSLELDPSVLGAVSGALSANFKREASGSAYVSGPVELGFYADRRMVKALTNAAEHDAKAAPKAK